MRPFSPPIFCNNRIMSSTNLLSPTTLLESLFGDSGRGRTGEGHGDPLQCSWASLMARTVKNPSGLNPWIGKIPQESGTTERLRFHFSLSCTGEGNGDPLQWFYLENPRDGGAWWAAVYGVAQSPTRLKWLISSRGAATHTPLMLRLVLPIGGGPPLRQARGSRGDTHVRGRGDTGPASPISPCDQPWWSMQECRDRCHSQPPTAVTSFPRSPPPWWDETPRLPPLHTPEIFPAVWVWVGGRV